MSAHRQKKVFCGRHIAEIKVAIPIFVLVYLNKQVRRTMLFKQDFSILELEVPTIPAMAKVYNTLVPFLTQGCLVDCTNGSGWADKGNIYICWVWKHIEITTGFETIAADAIPFLSIVNGLGPHNNQQNYERANEVWTMY